MLRLTGIVGALAALSVVVFGGSASAGKAAKGHDKATITMNVSHKDERLFFDGPKTVEAGEDLRIKNESNPRTIGPHTFTLVKKGVRPKGKNQIKACGHKLKGICGAVVKWHRINLDTFEIGKNPVHAGKRGWDAEGDLKHKGDSWLAERKGETFDQKVSAKAGDTLYFMCIVHPEMQGKIKVVAGS
jgi:hypothetical protein